MSSCDLVFEITALASTLASNLTTDQVSLLGAVFSQLGDTLNTIATQRSFLKDNSKNSSTTNETNET